VISGEVRLLAAMVKQAKLDLEMKQKGLDNPIFFPEDTSREEVQASAREFLDYMGLVLGKPRLAWLLSEIDSLLD
jgi:hypothetical protein